MSELQVTPSGYNHVFWAMAVGIALLLCVITEFAPHLAYLAGDAILCAVLAGWLTALWGARKPAPPTDSSES